MLPALGTIRRRAALRRADTLPRGACSGCLRLPSQFHIQSRSIAAARAYAHFFVFLLLATLLFRCPLAKHSCTLLHSGSCSAGQNKELSLLTVVGSLTYVRLRCDGAYGQICRCQSRERPEERRRFHVVTLSMDGRSKGKIFFHQRLRVRIHTFWHRVNPKGHARFLSLRLHRMLTHVIPRFQCPGIQKSEREQHYICKVF